MSFKLDTKLEIQKIHKEVEEKNGESYDPEESIFETLKKKKEFKTKTEIINTYNEMTHYHSNKLKNASDKEKQKRQERIKLLEDNINTVRNISNKDVKAYGDILKQNIINEQKNEIEIATQRVEINTDEMLEKLSEKAKNLTKKGKIAGTWVLDNGKNRDLIGDGKKIVTGGKAVGTGWTWVKHKLKGTDPEIEKLMKEQDKQAEVVLKNKSTYKENMSEKMTHEKHLKYYEDLKKQAEANNEKVLTKKEKSLNKKTLKSAENKIKTINKDIKKCEKTMTAAEFGNSRAESKMRVTGDPPVKKLGKIIEDEGGIKIDDKIEKKYEKDIKTIVEKNKDITAPKIDTGKVESGIEKEIEEVATKTESIVEEEATSSKVTDVVKKDSQKVFGLMPKNIFGLFIAILIIFMILAAIAIFLWAIIGIVAMYVAYKRHKGYHPLIRYGFAPIMAYNCGPWYLIYVLIMNSL